MWTWKWWQDVSERALRTFVAVIIPSLGASESGFDLLAVDWLQAINISAGAALATVLMAIATHGVTGNGPSFTSVYKNKPTEEAKNDDSSAA